jgi:hypothetical protein
MKRRKLLQHLNSHNCAVEREGKRHTWVQNLANGNRSFVPRHPEIKAGLAREICRQLGIPAPPGK